MSQRASCPPTSSHLFCRLVPLCYLVPVICKNWALKSYYMVEIASIHNGEPLASCTTAFIRTEKQTWFQVANIVLYAKLQQHNQGELAATVRNNNSHSDVKSAAHHLWRLRTLVSCCRCRLGCSQSIAPVNKLNLPVLMHKILALSGSYKWQQRRDSSHFS